MNATRKDGETATYQCRSCDWIGGLEDALDHHEATDHDCDLQPEPEPVVAECWTCLRRCYSRDCMACDRGVRKHGDRHVTALSAKGLAFHDARAAGHDVREVSR